MSIVDEKCDPNDFGLPFIITNTIGVSLLANARRQITSSNDTLHHVHFATSNAFFSVCIKIKFPHNTRIQKFEPKVIINNGYPFVSVEGQLIRCAIQNFWNGSISRLVWVNWHCTRNWLVLGSSNNKLRRPQQYFCFAVIIVLLKLQDTILFS